MAAEIGNGESRAGHFQKQWQTLRNTATQMTASDEEDNVSPQKRRRVSKACDQCRQGKLKCNGAIPGCTTCLDLKKPCTYGTTTKRRGLRTGYVRALECLWGLVFQSIGGSEDAVEKLIANTSRKNFWVRDDLRDGPRTEEPPLETWKLSRIPQAIDDLLSVHEDMDDDGQATVLSHAPFPTKDLKFSWSLLDQPPSNQQSQPNTTSQMLCQRCSAEVQEQIWKHVGSAGGQNHIQGRAPTAPDQMGRSTLPDLPPNSQKLLDHYFALTHSWFPVVDRHGVYKSLFAYRKRLSNKDVEDRKSGEEALLWAIFTYATMMHDTPGTGQGSKQQSIPPPNSLYMAARNNIPLETEDNYSNGHVQALLILALVHYSSCQWSITRIVIGKAILLAGHIGLDQWDKFQTDCHRRTWLGCFVLDTLTSVHTKKQTWIRSHHVQTFLPLMDETGNEEWEPWHLQGVLLPGTGAEMAEFTAPTHALSVFNKLLELLCITNDWMHSTTIERNNGCKQALKSWDDGLPEHIRAMFSVDAFSAATIPPPANVLNLHMAHALLCTRLSDSISTRAAMGLNCSHEWKTLIDATEGFLGRFDHRALPPSFNLLRNILPQKTSDHITLCELMTELKKSTHNHKSTERLPLHPDAPHIFGNENTENALVSQEYTGAGTFANGHPPSVSEPSHWVEDHSVGNLKADTMTYDLDPRIEQNFGSFIDIDGPWTNVLTDLLLEPQNGNFEDLCSQIGQQPIGTASVGDVSSQGVFSEDAAPVIFSVWDDVEVQDRDQFRRNLGFKF